MRMATRQLLLVLVSLLFYVCYSQASSKRPPPLKRLVQPDDVTLEILLRPSPSNSYGSNNKRSQDKGLGNAGENGPRRQVLHTDSIRLTVRAFSDVFHLHLQPNEDLIHPAARITHYKPEYGTDGRSVVDRVEPLLRESFLVFGGEVIDEEYTSAKMDEDAAGGIRRPYHSPYPNGHRGWARITLLDGGDAQEERPPVFEGAFSVDGVVHHVLTLDNYMRTKLPEDPEPVLGSQMVIFRDTDLMSHQEAEYFRTGLPKENFNQNKLPQTCAHDRLGFNIEKTHPVLRFGAGFGRIAPTSWYDPFGLVSPDESSAYNATLRKRQNDIGNGNGNPTSNFIDSIGSTLGCPTTQQIVYLGIASDCTYTKANGGNTNATQNILRTFNTVSLLYKSTFNISLGIVELQISDPTCPSSDAANPWNVPCGSASLNERLSLFSAWRGQKFNALNDPTTDPTGLWHLMSGCPSGTEVGVAWLGTVCVKTASGNAPSVVSGTGVSTAGRTEWQVIAHEIGHNFGAIHDCTNGCSLSDSCCPMNRAQCDSNNQFLMNPTSSATERVFSPCSIGNICSLMRTSNVDTSCIKPPDVNQQTFSLQMCGNGILEAGEECDPGAGSTSNCCDPTTCKFINGAVCDPSSSSCCTGTCQFAPKGLICRPSKDAQCDIAETCTGTSADCPSDKTAPNGQSCGTNGLACAMGTCTSVSQQCQVVGASLNLTKACPNSSDSSCQVSCQDPKNPSQCVVLNSQLIDGSPCGYGGTCITGNCKPGTLVQTAIAWYTKNLQISIPVSVVVGLVILIIVSSIIRCLWNCCNRKKSRANAASSIPPNVPGQRLPSWGPGMAQSNNMVTAGPFSFPPQRLNRNGSNGSNEIPRDRRRDSRIDERRPSDSSDNRRDQANANMRPHYPMQPSYERETTRPGNPRRNARNRTEDRLNWVDDRIFNGPRG
ncbi:hypothetical protein FRB91_011264 [Serendipita sp. 411]|nr:hypothetical protein FRC15_007788 [Serendipita sp. 397]KAG8857521.1 hypothetical protein FRB91_011264 [Serendipita sp. 411]